MEEETLRILVYGTLMKGFGNHALLGSEPKYIGEGTTLPEFTMYDLGGFPALASDGQTAIKGEIYDVGDSVLSVLDRLERHPVWYQRSAIQMNDGQVVEGYIMPRAHISDQATTVFSGNWRAYCEVRHKVWNAPYGSC
jgi:gamma-glutamylaminecyclotransferase